MVRELVLAVEQSPATSRPPAPSMRCIEQLAADGAQPAKLVTAHTPANSNRA
jgi:hypothetical protein